VLGVYTVPSLLTTIHVHEWAVQAGVAFDELEVYETVTSPALPPDMAFSGKRRGAQQQKQQRVDWMCFFSPSGVKAIHEELNKRGAEEEEGNGGDGAPRMAAIGPTTAKALTDTFGAPPNATASSPCALALFDAIEQCASSSSSMPPSEHEP
jgi:uroporphyrinogen-III synthase